MLLLINWIKLEQTCFPWREMPKAKGVFPVELISFSFNVTVMLNSQIIMKKLTTHSTYPSRNRYRSFWPPFLFWGKEPDRVWIYNGLFMQANVFTHSNINGSICCIRIIGNRPSRFAQQINNSQFRFSTAANTHLLSSLLGKTVNHASIDQLNKTWSDLFPLEGNAEGKGCFPCRTDLIFI
jgi:hypothetical protein